MVTIVDPHIKTDSNYWVYQELVDLGVAVRDANGEIFEGDCWPGRSIWADFTNPRARIWWASQFSLSKYSSSTLSLYTWNDMNEPSVFSGPEVTMPKDNVHYNGIEHRDVHNLYGQYMHRASFEGHLQRSPLQRPFILSRSFYAGTQRYGPIWTGDNSASYLHLRLSTPMILSLSIAGIPFVGADVGGFFGNPDPQLLTRWYQTGALQPFFRAHAHIDTKRREPWVFGDPWTSLIRDAIKLRYQLIPYIYTLFYESHLTGVPPMR
jgi:mannosyl-oligosaccharide alpha-1,3-glucosidase